ncbi:MAG: carbonic anhydrase, partial [Myxococcales bacterium]|nr:carbonic anhydrase [Myxococcales bacterium]
IHQFQSGVFGPQRELFARLAEGQSPDALMITCSDSRIDANLITQTKPGELFILRNAGNIVPAWGSNGGEAATVEYALEVLGIKDIIVCGHTHCGAVGAMVAPESVTALPAVRAWLDHAEATRRIMRDSYGALEGQALVDTAVEENVLAQIENLRTHPAVMSRLMRGQLTLHAWVYDIEDGSVHAFSPDVGQFVPVAEAGHGEPEPAERLRRHKVC